MNSLIQEVFTCVVQNSSIEEYKTLVSIALLSRDFDRVLEKSKFYGVIYHMKKMHGSHQIIRGESLVYCVAEGHCIARVAKPVRDHCRSKLLGPVKIENRPRTKILKGDYEQGYVLHGKCIVECRHPIQYIKTVPVSERVQNYTKLSVSLTRAYRRKLLNTSIWREWIHVNKEKQLVYVNFNWSNYPLKYYL